jgi:hypothetical protein
VTNELEGLGDEFVSWQKAGLDKEFTLFKLYTRKLHDNTTGEVGTFDLACRYELVKFEASKQPVELLKFLVRRYLEHAMNSVQVPIEMWIVEFSPIMERYQVPSHLFLDTGRDRAWLL